MIHLYKPVTVDGILLSPKEKQQYYLSCRPAPGLFKRLAYKFCF
ncbi:hypothetical protein [Coxiella-like endosymbiont of Rhipicephalus sanguineus]|nr:hypothetical protein [Coxiella-like endosymbiont of Rhipicephalus sanguineus]